MGFKKLRTKSINPQEPRLRNYTTPIEETLILIHKFIDTPRLHLNNLSTIYRSNIISMKNNQFVSISYDGEECFLCSKKIVADCVVVLQDVQHVVACITQQHPYLKKTWMYVDVTHMMYK